MELIILLIRNIMTLNLCIITSLFDWRRDRFSFKLLLKKRICFVFISRHSQVIDELLQSSSIRWVNVSILIDYPFKALNLSPRNRWATITSTWSCAYSPYITVFVYDFLNRAVQVIFRILPIFRILHSGHSIEERCPFNANSSETLIEFNLI